MPRPTNFPAADDRPHGRRRSYRWRRQRTEVVLPSYHGSLQLSTVRPVPRTALAAGTVVWAHIPFEDTAQSKLRPAVVKSVVGRAVTVLPTTSAASRHRYPHRHRELVDVTTAGLHRATGVRLAEVTLDLIDVVSLAGALGADDRQALLEPVALELDGTGGSRL
jgi:hypothetical protein